MQNIIIHKITLFISNVEFSLVFDDMLTLISGESGCGKSLMYRAFRCRSAEDDRIICFDGIDLTNRNIVEEIGRMRNKVVVIDNADSILTMEQRVEIALDRNNQYIIISNHSDGFCPGRNSLRELIVKNNKGKLVPVMG